MRGRHRKAVVIQVYTPDTNHDDEEVEGFYSQLEEELERTHEGDLVIVMGDFTSKTGSDNQGYEEVMGRHGVGERNDRGARLLEFCQHNSLCITNTTAEFKR